jgi:hypothetical protein
LQIWVQYVQELLISVRQGTLHNRKNVADTVVVACEYRRLVAAVRFTDAELVNLNRLGFRFNDGERPAPLLNTVKAQPALIGNFFTSVTTLSLETTERPAGDFSVHHDYLYSIH